MHIAVVNESTVVPKVAPMVNAVDHQLRHHVAPAWDREPPTVHLCRDRTEVPADADLIAVLDDADQADALGYHDVDPSGQPYGRVFAKTVLDNHGTLSDGPDSVSACLSHEACELFVDPGCEQWDDRGDGEEVAHEACDPVQGDFYNVTVRGHTVSVSNFVLPAYFEAAAKAPYDHLTSLHSPFQIHRAGYLIVRQTGKESEQFGTRLLFGKTDPPAWQASMKLAPAARTVRRGFR